MKQGGLSSGTFNASETFWENIKEIVTNGEAVEFQVRGASGEFTSRKLVIVVPESGARLIIKLDERL